jgi:hypothetical protein
VLTSGAVAPVSESRHWLVSGVAYAASFVGATIALHAFDQPASFISWLVAVVLGSTIAALLVGRPPALLPLVLFPAYYVVVALSVSGYDESQLELQPPRARRILPRLPAAHHGARHRDTASAPEGSVAQRAGVQSVLRRAYRSPRECVDADVGRSQASHLRPAAGPVRSPRCAYEGGDRVDGRCGMQKRRRSLDPVVLRTDMPWTDAVALYRACGLELVRQTAAATHFAVHRFP